MKVKKILYKSLGYSLNESGEGDSAMERWFFDNTNLERKSGKAYIRVSYQRIGKRGKPLKTRQVTLSTFLKDPQIENFLSTIGQQGTFDFSVDMSRKYDAILNQDFISLEKFGGEVLEEEQKKIVDIGATFPQEKKPFYFELKGFDINNFLDLQTGSFLFQSSRVSTYESAYRILNNLFLNNDYNFNQQLENYLGNLNIQNIFQEEDTEEKKTAREKFKEFISQKIIQEKIEEKITQTLEDKKVSFFEELSNYLNDNKEFWILPQSYFLLSVDTKDINIENFEEKVSNGIRKIEEKDISLLEVQNKRIPPFKHIEAKFEVGRESLNDSTKYKKNKVINEILNIANVTETQQIDAIDIDSSVLSGTMPENIKLEFTISFSFQKEIDK